MFYRFFHLPSEAVVLAQRSSILSYIVPTRYETLGEAYWLFSNRDRALVLTEYAKIAWFLLYSNFF